MENKKKSILFVAPFPPPVHGSAMMSQYIRNCESLVNTYRCDFINLSTSREMNEIGHFSFRKIIRFISSFLGFIGKILTRRYDICYLAITCHGSGFLKDMSFVLFAKMFSKQVVLHQHNKGMSKFIHRQPYKWLFPLVYSKTKVILLSWHLYNDIENVVNKEQVLICPNGIPSLPGSKECQHHSYSVPHILFLSNLIPSKGVYVLLNACQILKTKGIKFKCAFVGGETKEINRDSFEDEVLKRDLKSECVYYGPKYGDEKVDFLKWADIFVQPTYEDCFPLTILEAMQFRLPVISTDEGAIPDLVLDGVTGFVCQQHNFDDLAIKLSILLKDEFKCRKMGEAGALRFEKFFSKEIFQRNFLSLINEII